VVAKTVVLEAIHRFKYQRALWFENFLADLLIREAASVLRGQKWDFIAPVPRYPLNLREPEFHQATRVAAPLAAATGIPLNEKILQRTAPTATQTWLTRAERPRT
jgi:predicted amidophosphoribosyltransferase